MPIYDYRCTACGHRFETRQGFHDDPVAQCPVCGEPAERQITAVAVHFKGSGFYKTDYASGSSRSNGNGKSETKTESSTESKSESKSDSKSEKSSTTSDSKSSTEPAKSRPAETASKSTG